MLTMLRPAPAPRPAATIMLLRDAGSGIEVLLTQRHEKLAFMGGLWVFPGGTLRPEDTSQRALARIADHADAPCLRLRTLNGTSLTTQECLGLAVAACRETFEETGVLLAVDARDHSCPLETYAQLQPERTIVAADPQHFAFMLEREQLWLDAGRLVYWAHWITPSSAPRRFDTRFFALALEPGQAIAADTTETTECRWMRPAEAVTLARSGELPLSQPTLYMLMDLLDSQVRNGPLQALLDAEAQRVVPPILPKLLDGAPLNTIVMPWDESYAAAQGENAPGGIEYSSFLLSQPSRLTMRRR